MFFGKSSSQTTTTPHNIAILGANALGLYWADIFKNLGHNVFVLCSPKKAEEYNATDFTFRDSAHLKNQRNNFHFGHELPFMPEFLLITVSAQHQISDLTLLCPNILSDTIVINFCFPNLIPILSEIIRKPTINTFFEGWVNRNQNHISIFGRSPRITFNLSDTSEDAPFLRDLFESSDLKIIFNEHENESLWNFAAPFLAHNLLTARFNCNIFDFGKTETGRHQIDTLLEEISRIAQADNIRISTAELLTKVYEIPSAYVSSLQKSIQTKNPLFFQRINTFLLSKTGQNERKYPFIHQIIQEIRNKY